MMDAHARSIKPSRAELFTATRARPAPRAVPRRAGVEARVQAVRSAARELTRRSQARRPRKARQAAPSP
jgi:hypothetical protein